MVLMLGFTGILGKLIELSNTHLVWYRMLLAFITLFLFAIYKKQLFKIPKKTFLSLLGIGFIVALHWIFFFGAIKSSNVSVAVICMSTGSLFSALLEPIFFNRKILKYEVIFGFIALLSLSYMMYEKPDGIDTNYKLGYTYGIISAFLGTLFTILNAKYIQKIEASMITMTEMLGGTLLLTMYFVFIGDYSIFYTKIQVDDFIYLLILATICTAGIFVWMTEIMKHVTPYSLIMAINLEPVYTILLGLVIFGESEKMNFAFYIGSFIILSLVFIESHLKNKKVKNDY